MKIYINRKPVTGPWGGGNKTLTELCDQLNNAGHEVVYRLNHDDINLIFCFDPRPNGSGEWYQNFLNYKTKHSIPIIQRVGDCGTHGKPDLTSLVKQSVLYSDFIIFPSEWAKKQIGFKGDKYEIIHNAPLSVFHNFKKTVDLSDDKIKVVTHHWSPNPKKGYSLYKKLDEYLFGRDDISFRYIGQWPIEPLKSSEYYSPTGDNKFISEKISECDIYLTASEEEAGANHVLEGMACGLPVVYHINGGSIPEYCKDYGLGFEDFNQMIGALKTIKQSYVRYKNNVLKYENNVTKAVKSYMEIINGIF
jgi:glycosyltransferase involved in cell wall biosynthesis